MSFIKSNTANHLNLPKASGEGIQVDSGFPWRDIISEFDRVAGQPNAPVMDTWRGGSTRVFFYSAGDVGQSIFHTPHDYAPGTDLFLHLHWGHQGTAISGSLVVTYGITYAKGHNQAAFPNEILTSLTVSTPNIATIPQYQHRIDEIQISSITPSGTLIDTALLEPDGLILVGVVTTAIPTITGGGRNLPAFLNLDIHYQSTSVGTKEKAPNFYV